MKRITLVLLAFGFLGQSASAEDWDWQIAPYLWTSSISSDLALGPVEIDTEVEFSDILDLFDGGGLLHIEAQRGAQGFFGDVVFLALEPDDSFSPVGGETDADLDTLILEAGYLHKFPHANGFAGVEVGLRYWNFDLSLEPALIAGIDRDKDWVDGFVGFRFNRELSGQWSYVGRANVGAGGSDLTWELDGTFLRERENGDALAIGFKVLTIDNNKDSGGSRFVVDATFFGLTFGYVFD